MSDMPEINFTPGWRPNPASRKGARGPQLIAGGDGPPERPFVVTVSEIQSFRRCQWAWDFTSANRQSLMRRGMPIPALNIGGGVHYALHRHWLGENWLAAVNDHYTATKNRVEKDYLKQVGTGLSSEEYRILVEQRWEVQRLLEAYFARYGTDWPTKPYKVVAAELTFAVPLVPDQNIWLMGTIDRVCTDRDGNALPGEIKTYKSAPDPKRWRFNFQCYIYACALSILINSVPPLFLYDGIRKKGPTEPQILVKSGKVSKRWIDTTYDEYIRTVRHAHRGKVPEEYRDILTRLMARDHSPQNAFTTRFRIPLLRSAMDQYWAEAGMTAQQMRYSYDNIVANKDWQGCLSKGHRIKLWPGMNSRRTTRRRKYRQGNPTIGAGRPIETLRVGDVLVGYNEDTKQLEPTTVVAFYERPGVDDIYRLFFKSGRSLQLTNDHPLYINGKWIAAEDASLGDEVHFLGKKLPRGGTSKRGGRPWKHGICAGCREWVPNLEHDYVIALNSGGEASEENTQWLCPVCHRIKTEEDRSVNPFGFNDPEVRERAIQASKATLENGDRIIAIERIEDRVTVYNVTCEPVPNYFANGLLVHNCPMCRVNDLCDAKLAGEDLAGLIARDYTKDVSPTRRAVRIATPKKVKSLEQLIEFAKEIPIDPLREHSILGADD